MCIEDYIPYGKENAVTREQLVILTGLSDCQIRGQIAKARRHILILNLQDGQGYYRPTSDERADVERFVRQEKSRASKIFWSLKAADDFLSQVNGQIDITNMPK